jgi:hypothetical protein
MAGPIAGNTFNVAYEFMNAQRFTGNTTIAADTLEDAATLAVTAEGQALFNPPLPTNFTDFALLSVTRVEPRAGQIVINET